tara:strand:- start:227 stop:460 length:234 start_codon:yes stop_codon:yes gene_type:complete
MKEKLNTIFNELFNVLEVRDDMTPEKVDGWDSFSHIELVLELEKAFTITIPTSDAIKLISIKEIMNYISSIDAKREL